MALDRRVWLVGLGGVALGAAAMAIVPTRTAPPEGAGLRTPVADPFIPGEPGGPNAIGKLAVEKGGGPRTPTVKLGAGAPRRLVVPFTVRVDPADPGAAWPCVNAVGVWSLAHLDSAAGVADASGDTAVAAACRGSSSGTVSGKLRLATRTVPGPAGSEPRQSCEASLSLAYTGMDGKEHRPEVRNDGEAAGGSACATAFAGLEKGFRTRLAASP